MRPDAQQARTDRPAVLLGFAGGANGYRNLSTTRALGTLGVGEEE